MHSTEIRRHWVSFCTIYRREVARFMRVWLQTLMPPAITMTLYFLVFGQLMGQRIGTMDGLPYIQYIVPGLIMLTVITNSYNNAVTSFFFAKFQHNIEEMLVSPVAHWVVLLGYITSSVTRGLMTGLMVFLISLVFTSFGDVHHWGALFGMAVLAATLFSLIGFFNAMFAEKFDDISFIPTFVLTPLTYLGGIFYSVNILPETWQIISKANPILYIVNTFRYGMLGVSDISSTHSFMLVGLFSVVFAAVILHLLKIGYGIRH